MRFAQRFPNQDVPPHRTAFQNLMEGFELNSEHGTSICDPTGNPTALADFIRLPANFVSNLFTVCGSALKPRRSRLQPLDIPPHVCCATGAPKYPELGWRCRT